MMLRRPLVIGAVALISLDASAAKGPYASWMQDPEVRRYLESRFIRYSEKNLAEFIRSSNEAPNILLAGVFLDGRHVGNIKLNVDAHHKRGEMGILIGEREVWGRGVARQAIGLLADHAFNELGVIKLSAGCYGPNLGSIMAFKAAGFHIEAIRPGHYICDGQSVDGIYLARFASGREARP